MLQRSHARFPCVGIDLMFSPLQDDYVEGMGAKIYQAVSHDMSFSGLSFDIVQAMDIGERILIIVENQFQPSERLHGEVRWCKPISAGVYRIGVRILLEESLEHPINLESPLQDIAAHKMAMPTGAELRCPACQEQTVFELVDTQQGHWAKGILPLYTCSACKTERKTEMLSKQNGDLPPRASERRTAL